MAAAAGADDLGREDSAVLDLVEFKLGAVAEMLEDLPVFIIGNRDFHTSIVPFGLEGGGAGAELVVAAGNRQLHPADNALGQFPPGVAVDCLDGRPGNPHLGGGFRLGEAAEVDQPDGLVFVQRHDDPGPFRASPRAEPAAAGEGLDPSSFAGTGHPSHLL